MILSKKMILILVLMSQIFAMSTPAFAANNNFKRLRTPFYDAADTGQTCQNGGVAPNIASGNKSAFLIGDSIGARATDAIKTSFSNKSWSINIDALTSRTISGGSVSPDGLGAAIKNKAEIGKVGAIIIELGSNTAGFTASNVNTMIDQLKSMNSSAQIFWVDTAVIGRPNYAPVLSKINETIYSVADQRQFKVIPWSKAVLGDNSNPNSIDPTAQDTNGYINTSDSLGVHPTTTGSTALADLISSTVTNVDSSSTTDTSSGCGCSATALNGNDDKTKIVNYLLGKGLSSAAVAGLAGNIQDESGFSPTATNPKSGAYGIVQWLGGRLTNLQSFAQEKGLQQSDLSLQLDFMWKELDGSYRSNITDKINAPDTTYQDATLTVYSFYEGLANSGQGSVDNRINNARLIMELISSGNTTNTSASTTSTSGCGVVPAGQVDSGNNVELAQKLLDYKTAGKYNCDNTLDCTDLQRIVKGETLSGHSSCIAQTLDSRVMQLLIYLIDSGFTIGTFALCGDHDTVDGPNGHNGGFAVDISTINGVAVNSPSARASTLLLLKFIHESLPETLKVRQLISGGYGDPNNNPPHAGVADPELISLSIPNTPGYYVESVLAGHRNHVHVGY